MKISPKALRTNAELTQQEVADHLGISVTSYRNKEKGHSDWLAKEVFLLSKLYNVPMDYFFVSSVSKKDTTKVLRS